MVQFLWGALTASCTVAAMFFLRFWKLTRDRIFLFFGSAFAVLAVNWLGLAIANPLSEGHHRLYVIRLVAYALIIAGVLDKNKPRDG
jgi:hypothetical protein